MVIKLPSHISKFVLLKTLLRDSRVGTMLSTFSSLPAGFLIDSDSTENKGMLGASRREKGLVLSCLLSVPVKRTCLHPSAESISCDFYIQNPFPSVFVFLLIPL